MNTCQEGLACQPPTPNAIQVQEECLPAPIAGEPCVVFDELVYCAPGNYCGSDKLCHALPGAGHPCASDLGIAYQPACAEGTRCADAWLDGKCQPKP